MRNIFLQSAVSVVLGLSGVVLGSACFETATVGVEGPTPDAGTSDECTGTNPGCCSADCSVKAPEATCTKGEWTCPSGDTLGPACPAICETDGGPPGNTCTGDNPGCCSTDCSPDAPKAPQATCSDGAWTCPTGDSVGPACPLICTVDGGPPGNTCTGANPGCCTTDCGTTAPEATCSDGNWTCPSGDTLGPACSKICREDGGAPPTCAGANPGCCSTDCSVPAPEATCSDGSWTCPSGDTLGPVCPLICTIDGGPPTTCEGSNPGCCSTDCNGPQPPEATCSNGTWTCPGGDTLGPICSDICVIDGGPPSNPDSGAPCTGEAPSCCFGAPLCETLSAISSCSDGQWTCPPGATLQEGACACPQNVDGGTASPG